MAAYAALVSLFNDLELIPNHLIHSFSFDDKQISSLSQTVELLIDFMDSYDSHGCTREAVEVLETRIASAAHAAHDVVESHVVDQICTGSTRGGNVRSYFLLDLQKAIDNMDFVKREIMQFKAKSGLKAEQPTYSSSSAAAEPLMNNFMVGFDEVVLRSWIGEGFIKPKKGSSLEEVGKDFLKDPIDRNLILVYERSWNGKVEYCKIHDTVRELCLKECKKEKFMYVVEDTTQVIWSTERRIVIPEGKKL